MSRHEQQLSITLERAEGKRQERAERKMNQKIP